VLRTSRFDRADRIYIHNIRCCNITISLTTLPFGGSE
jgi:hypothetical protein